MSSNNQKTKLPFTGVVMSVLGVVFFLFLIIGTVKGCGERDGEPDPTSTNQVAMNPMTLVDSSMVGPDSSDAWVTPVVTYKYHIGVPGGESFYAQLETRDGGWTSKILIQSNQKTTLDPYIVRNKKPQGRIRITPGPKETKSFQANLYRRN